MRSAPSIAVCFAMFGQLASAQQSQQPRQPLDQTPPPRGTASLEPSSTVDKEPLMAHTFVIRAGVADMTEVVAGHDEAIALYDAAASSEKLPEVLQRYATRTLPVIRTHRDAAHGLHEKEGV